MIITPREFKEYKRQPYARVIGLDVGTKTIGLALSDTGLLVATPLLTIKRQKFHLDYAELHKIIQEFKIQALIIGFPLNMDGSEGPRCQSVRQFAKNVLAQQDIPIIFWDERLSTVAVTKHLIAADFSRKKREKLVDMMAASYILQGFLDCIKAP